MKKHFTVLVALTLLLAFTAIEAMASVSAINSSIAGAANTDGAKYRVAGFQVANSSQIRPMFSPALITGNMTIWASSAGFTNVNQSVYVRNASLDNFVVRGKGGSVVENVGPNGLTGFYGFKHLNSSQTELNGVLNTATYTSKVISRKTFNSTRWVAFSPSGTFFASVDNSTYNASSTRVYGQSRNGTNGTMLFTGVQMVSGGAADTVLAAGDTWYFYQILLNATTKTKGAYSLVGWREGSFQKISGTGSPYQARVYWTDSLNSTIRTTSDFALSSSPQGGIRLSKGATVLIGNGTMDNSTKIIIAASPDNLNGTLGYTIALKGASIMAQADFARGWNMFSAGAMGGNNTSANDALGGHKAMRVYNMLGVFAARNDASATAGASMVGRLIIGNSSNGHAGNGAMLDLSPINLAAENAKVTVSTFPAATSFSSAATGVYTKGAVGQTKIAINVNNSTRLGSSNKLIGQMRGRWLGASDGVFAGIYLGNNTYNSVGIVIAMAKTAIAGAVSNASSSCTNASGVVRFVNTYNGSERGAGGVKSISYYGWQAVKTRYGLSGYTPLLSNWVTFNASVKGYDASHPVYTFNYPVTGLTIDKVTNLALLKINNSTLTTGSSNALARGSNTYRAFNYAANKALVDGNWWISETQGGAAIAQDQALDPLKTYYITTAIADSGAYECGTGPGSIFDPQLLASYVPGSSTSSSSTGCVFNPTAGFGLEWLMLLIAPALGIIRSRLKK